MKKLTADDERPEMEAIKYFLWLNPDRSSLFFADTVILVEGATESAFINKLIDDGKINIQNRGLYILDCMGKYNTHRFMNLLNRLGICYVVLYDDDNNKEEHSGLNQLIKDSNNPEFTMKIYPIQKDIETFLGIDPATSPHRKPQHLLYRYSEKKIPQDKLNEFCKIIESCFHSEIDNTSLSNQ